MRRAPQSEFAHCRHHRRYWNDPATIGRTADRSDITRTAFQVVRMDARSRNDYGSSFAPRRYARDSKDNRDGLLIRCLSAGRIGFSLHTIVL